MSSSRLASGPATAISGSRATTRTPPRNPPGSVLNRCSPNPRTGPSSAPGLSLSCPTRRCETLPIRRSTLLSFLESAYRAGAGLAGWEIDDLTSSWCPDWLPRLLGDG